MVTMWIYAFVAVAIVILATLAVWIEQQVERRERPKHREVLENEPRYRDWMSRRR